MRYGIMTVPPGQGSGVCDWTLRLCRNCARMKGRQLSDSPEAHPRAPLAPTNWSTCDRQR